MLVNLRDILADAKQKKYAIFATNAFNFDSAEIIIDAAEEKKSPVILMVAEPLFKYFNYKFLMGPIISMSKEASVPVCVNLDHGDDLGVIMKCIDAGVSSVMFDGSSLPLNENIKTTKEITEVAHSRGISVEGEVGMIGGMEGAVKSNDTEIMKKYFTTTKDAEKYVKETNVDALAIAVGTVHGVFTSKPDIDFERITNIRKQIETPLVLHGCSGLSDDDFKKAIQNGITKLNYYTDLVLEAARKAKEIINGEGETNYLELNRNIMIAIKNMIMRKMDVFGSSGKG